MPFKSDNPIERIINVEAPSQPTAPPNAAGAVADIARQYTPSGDHLLGFLLDMSYEEVQIVTCDSWKQRCGGVPRNSFVIIKLGNAAGRKYVDQQSSRLILARITEAIPTPVKQDIQQTIFQIHKVQALLDPITNADLQWGALKASILGTYHEQDGVLSFGNDIDSFFSPHFYEAYAPTDKHLADLINSFVAQQRPVKIGRLRYTETQPTIAAGEIPVFVSPTDFIRNRTALFGKTRMGKSNTIKVIADTVLHSGTKTGQVIFDLSGEYAYYNDQDKTSLYLMHRDKCSRYCLLPRQPEEELKQGVPAPIVLKANFFEQVALGHSIITSLFDSVHSSRPDYVAQLLAWEPVDEADMESRFPDKGDRTHYQRALSMYFAVLHRAGFESQQSFSVELHLNRDLKKKLAEDDSLREVAQIETETGKPIVSENQPIGTAAIIYDKLYALHKADPDNTTLFPPSKTKGRPYFDPLALTLLRILGDRGQISGPNKFVPFKQYHDRRGTNVVRKIVADVDAGLTVIVDLSNADEIVASYYSEMICKAILGNQMRKFADAKLGDHSVLFYFEEAHNLFRQDDKDLTSIYNKLAKEGAKFAIGMVYATQSMSTLSPDLLKNTENFFIAHLNDDREIKEVTRRYEFRDIALDVQRSKTKGFVRMITLSHRFALPVQVRKFEADPTQAGSPPGSDASSEPRLL